MCEPFLPLLTPLIATLPIPHPALFLHRPCVPRSLQASAKRILAVPMTTVVLHCPLPHAPVCPFPAGKCQEDSSSAHDQLLSQHIPWCTHAMAVSQEGAQRLSRGMAYLLDRCGDCGGCGGCGGCVFGREGVHLPPRGAQRLSRGMAYLLDRCGKSLCWLWWLCVWERGGSVTAKRGRSGTVF